MIGTITNDRMLFYQHGIICFLHLISFLEQAMPSLLILNTRLLKSPEVQISLFQHRGELQGIKLDSDAFS